MVHLLTFTENTTETKVEIFLKENSIDNYGHNNISVIVTEKDKKPVKRTRTKRIWSVYNDKGDRISYKFSYKNKSYFFDALPKDIEDRLNRNQMFNQFGLVNIKSIRSESECDISDELLKVLIRTRFDKEMMSCVEFMEIKTK